VPIAKCFPTGGSTTPTAPADPYGEPLAFNSGPWGSTITTSSALGPDSTWAGNNSVWLAIGAMRSSYSIQPSEVPFRISKMTIYERRFA
jgi:hypothetical protein